MKRLFFIAATMMCAGAAFSQVDSTQEAVVPSDTSASSTSINQSAGNGQSDISDEELKRYAVTMDSINGMKQTLLDQIANKVRSNTGIQVARYNELYKIIDDQAKLTEAKATPEEIAFVKEVDAFKDAGASKINEQFQTLARDYVGVATFNKIKNSLATDDDLKGRYDQILADVEASGGAATN